MLLKWLLYLKIRSRQTWLIILVLCLASLLMIQSIEEKKEHRYFATNYATDSFMTISHVKKAESLTESEKLRNPKAESSFQLLDEVGEKIWNLSYSEDYREMNRLITLITMLHLREQYPDTKANLDVNATIQPIWSDIAKDIPYESIDFAVREKGVGTIPTNMYLLMAQYHHYLYMNNLDMLFNDELSTINILYTYLDTLLPFAIVILSIFLAYNTINIPKKDGKIKLLISSGYDRKKLYLSVWASNLFQILLILMIPICLLYSGSALSGENMRLNYPMVVRSNPLTEIHGIPNFYDCSLEVGRISELYPNAIGRIPPLNDHFVYGGDFNSNTQVIPFYQLLMLSLCLAILFVAFLSAIAIFISALIQSSIVSLTISGIVFMLGYLGTMHLTKMDHINLSPFTMFNPVRILEGVYNTTFISSGIILLLCTVVLLFSGCKVFEHKNI